MSKTLIKYCGLLHSESVQVFYECFKALSVNGDTMILQTKKFNFKDFSFENTTFSIWKSLSSYYFGQCVTTNDISSLEDGQLLKIYLNKSMEYKIWIHDADYFYLSLNPKSIPKLELDYSPMEYSTVLQYLEKKKYVQMNRIKDCIKHLFGFDRIPGSENRACLSVRISPSVLKFS